MKKFFTLMCLVFCLLCNAKSNNQTGSITGIVKDFTKVDYNLLLSNLEAAKEKTAKEIGEILRLSPSLDYFFRKISVKTLVYHKTLTVDCKTNHRPYLAFSNSTLNGFVSRYKN